MSLFAHLLAIGAEAGQAALAQSDFAYAKPGAAKGGGCTPCAVAQRRTRAEEHVAQLAGRSPPTPAPRRKAAAR